MPETSENKPCSFCGESERLALGEGVGGCRICEICIAKYSYNLTAHLIKRVVKHENPESEATLDEKK